MNVIVTGGAGYIGSHTCLELLQAGYQVTVIDNLCNSKQESLRRVQQITGKSLDFYHVDLLDLPALRQVFHRQPCDAVIHFAGLKAVGESVYRPWDYYHNNVAGTLNLCKVMAEYNIKALVFSSSATVYGDPAVVPIPEEAPLSATNPYGRTKLMIEDILRDLAIADTAWRIAILRYFNPIGAHPSGLIGEDPNGIPNNLVPYIAQVAVGKLPGLNIFGNDYPTPDGTGIRDYIHVVDLALGHLKALEKIEGITGTRAFNLGTGKGYSVLEVVNAFANACGKPIPYKFVSRRPGDIAICYSDPSRAHVELNWQAQRGLETMCADTWRWQIQNPDGYE